MCELKIPLRTLLEHPDFELFRTFRQISRNSRAARHLPCAVIKLIRSVDIGPMAHIPRHVPRRSLASSGPSIYREAAQIARHIAFLGIQYGRAPFFGKVPNVKFLMQRYTVTCAIFRTRLPALVRPQNFKSSNQSKFSVVSDFKRCFNKSRDFCKPQGRELHTFIAPEKKFSSFRLGYAKSQSARPY